MVIKDYQHQYQTKTVVSYAFHWAFDEWKTISQKVSPGLKYLHLIYDFHINIFIKGFYILPDGQSVCIWLLDEHKQKALFKICGI